MKSVKWCLVNVHVWIIMFDYSIGFLTMPFLLIPSFGGYPLGYLRHFGIPTLFQVMLVYFIYGCLVASIVLVFENRFYKVCSFRIKYYWQKIRKPWISFQYIAALSALMPFYFLAPDQYLLTEQIFRTLPCLPRYIYEAPVYVFSEHYLYHLIMISAYLSMCGTEIFSIIGYVGYTTIQQMKTRTVSDKTFQMQKAFFIALVIQISIPFLLVVVPLLSWLVLIIGFWYCQWITNLGIIMITTHGSVATLTMLIAHRPYREAIISMIRKRNSALMVTSQRAVYSYRVAISEVQN